MSAGQDQLDKDEHARILYGRVISDYGVDTATSHDKPKAIILGGQPGAGKGGLTIAAVAELDGDVVIIDPDELRRHHPKVDQFRDENPYTWSSRTHVDASAWADEAFDASSAAKTNLILDKTLGNGERAADLIWGLQKKGYEVEVRVVAAHKLESELGVDRRFTQSMDAVGHGRYVPQGARHAIYDSIPHSLDILQASTDVPIFIYNREGDLLYDSRVDPRPAGQALQEERTNRLRDPVVTQYLRATWGDQVDWHEKVPERAHEIPAMNAAKHGRLLSEHSVQGVGENARVQAQVGASLDEIIRPGAPPAVVIREPKAPDLKRFGLGMGATVLGAAASAYDAHETAKRAGSLLKEQNLPAAQSELTHFAARGVGGWAGGTLAAGLVGTTGAAPMALIAADAYLFSAALEKAATLRENHSIYNQQDKAGTDWKYNGHAWVREASLDRTQDGVANPIKQDVSATYEKTRELNALASARAVTLELGKVPAPQDPFNMPARPSDQRGLDNANWLRDAQTEQWVRQVKTGVSGANDRGSYTQEVASPERAKELDQEAVARIKDNIANGREAVVAAYVENHAALRSQDYVAVPPAVEFARAKADVARGSDDRLYSRDEAGQWTHEGVAAQGNRALELELTRAIRQPSLEQFDASLYATLARPAPTAAEVDRNEVLHRYQTYNVRVPEDYLPAIELATQRTREAQGVTGRTIQELQPAESGLYSADSAIVHYQAGPDGVAQPVAFTSTEEIQRAHAELQAQALDRAPLPDTPELRIDRLSPREQEAHQQALREANRQGASTAEAQQAATFAAMAAGGADVDEARAPQLPEDVVQAVPSQAFAAASATAAPAQIAAAAITAAPALPDHDAQPKQQTEAPRPPTQDAAATAEQQRSREDTARNAEHADQLHREDNALHRQQQPAQQAADFVSVPERSERTVLPTTEAPERASAAGQAQEAELLKSRNEAPTRNENAEGTRQLPTATTEASVEPETEGPRLHTAETAELQAARFHAEPSPTGAAEHERLAAPENDRPSEDLANAQVAPTEVSPPQGALTETPAPPDEAVPWTPVNPHHPDHALYQQIRKEVARLDESHGRSYDQTSERLTGSLLVLAKSNGLDRVDHVALSSPTAQQPGAHTVFVVQGDMGNPGHLRAGMLTEQAVKTPFEESLEQFDVAAHEQEQRNQQLNLQRQLEDDKVQHDMQIAAASVGG